VLNFFTALSFGTMTPGEFSTKGMEYMGYVFLQSLMYMFFALLLAVVFRRSGLAIIIFFLYGIIFEWLIAATLTFQFKLTPFSYFLPLQTSDVLIPFPFGKEVFYPDTPGVGVLVAGIVVYIGLYLFFTRRKFVTDDL
jgi:ABC-2 type transport system permease protein